MNKGNLITRFLIILVLSSCLADPNDDDDTSVLVSAFNEGTFSTRIFELKVDSTFRYWKNVHNNIDDVQGKWLMGKDTFILFKTSQSDTTIYGKIYLANAILNEHQKQSSRIKPYFLWDITDSSLYDLTNHNAGYSLRYINPPENIHYGVKRKKPNKEK